MLLSTCTSEQLISNVKGSSLVPVGIRISLRTPVLMWCPDTFDIGFIAPAGWSSWRISSLPLLEVQALPSPFTRSVTSVGKRAVCIQGLDVEGGNDGRPVEMNHIIVHDRAVLDCSRASTLVRKILLSGPFSKRNMPLLIWSWHIQRNWHGTPQAFLPSGYCL